MTLEEVRRLPAVLTVPEAGRVLGLRRSAAYDAARRGELPTLRFGRKVIVPTGRLLGLLGLNEVTAATVGVTEGVTGRARPA
jgi:excisionase family DNA binding protein